MAGREGHSEKSDLEEKVLHVNRCSKVVKGGRKFSFSALICVGNRNGKIGFGFSKANELSDAIRKGGEAARKNLVQIKKEGSTIPHEVYVDWDGVSLMLKPARPGTGVIAGSKVRAVLELAGVEDVVAKNLGANNPINQVRAVFKALEQLRTIDEIKKMRGTET